MKIKVCQTIHTNLSKRYMRQVVTNNAEPSSAKESTKIIIIIIDRTYEKYNLEEVTSNMNPINSEEQKLLPGLLK